MYGHFRQRISLLLTCRYVLKKYLEFFEPLSLRHHVFSGFHISSTTRYMGEYKTLYRVTLQFFGLVCVKICMYNLDYVHIAVLYLNRDAANPN